jgi:hypothetical protein
MIEELNPMCDRRDVRFPTSKIDGVETQHIGGDMPHPYKSSLLLWLRGPRSSRAPAREYIELG